MRYHNEPRGEIHHAALIQHQDIQYRDVTGNRRRANSRHIQASIPHLRVSFVWSTLKSLRRGSKKKKLMSILSGTKTLFWWLLYYVLLLLFQPIIPPVIMLFCVQTNCFFCFFFTHQQEKKVKTYTGSSPPTSCLRCQGSTSACARIPAVHLAEKRGRAEIREKTIKIVICTHAPWLSKRTAFEQIWPHIQHPDKKLCHLKTTKQNEKKKTDWVCYIKSDAEKAFAAYPDQAHHSHECRISDIAFPLHVSSFSLVMVFPDVLLKQNF